MLTVLSVQDAKEKILLSVPQKMLAERVPLASALGRIVANPVTSTLDLPPFARSTMDGFAVRAEDTYGASEAMPALFRVTGEILMGQAPPTRVSTGTTLHIATGGMLPEGSNAVVMVELTEFLDATTLAVYRAVAPGENIITTGEDFHVGQEVLPEGHRVRAQDIGILASLGVTDVPVSRKPRVALLS
ncbi:MAG: molybdopterin molybdenumtransferase MoeA, partial [Firmicutes bacterium]|nr:molybdopterin molybdenumtransferase MoeA [Bacillota bacterium]